VEHHQQRTPGQKGSGPGSGQDVCELRSNLGQTRRLHREKRQGQKPITRGTAETLNSIDFHATGDEEGAANMVFIGGSGHATPVVCCIGGREEVKVNPALSR